MQSKISETFGNRLRVRPCGILIENEKLLLIQHINLGEEKLFWSPPGGGQKFGETMVNSLKREFLEETGLQIEPINLMFIHEFLQLPLHAIELFFHVKNVGGKLAMGNDPELGADYQIIKEMKFFSIAELNALPQGQLHPCLHKLKSWEELISRTI
jgi:8-oxo-dGTP diphosphatase